ncbi:hypothetical protein [Corynebacterium macginleyi]|uniref:hypothetical protein n=1 Tax=Corynebacterium macginleyi TaxID=38290 RepID=UPI001F4549C5|nr:hypothetical protein [Corynebacterium macginleyi]
MKRIASVPAVWVGWVLARLLLVYFIKIDHDPRGDVAYYFFGVFDTDTTHMTEYPHAGTWPTVILSYFTGEELSVFYIGFTIMALLVDATFLALLLRHHGRVERVFSPVGSGSFLARQQDTSWYGDSISSPRLSSPALRRYLFRTPRPAPPYWDSPPP